VPALIEAHATGLPESYHRAYHKAFELAATNRFPEAREKLLQILGEHPDAVDALVLLGKVEYYLGKKAASRQRFETALTYQPDNLPAWFGLQYYREHRFAAALALALAMVIISGLASAVLLYRGLDDRLNHQTLVQTEQLRSELATVMASHVALVDTAIDAITATADRTGTHMAALEASIRGQLHVLATDKSELEDRLRGIQASIAELGKRLPAGPLEGHDTPDTIGSSPSD